MHTASDIPGFSGADRLGLTIFGSLLVHVIIVLGITFTVPKLSPEHDIPPTLEVTLVQSRSKEAPEEADFLAQANQEGGGESEKAEIARSPLPVQELAPTPQTPAARPKPQPEVAAPTPQPEVLAAPSDQRADLPEPKPQPKQKTQAVEPPAPGLTRLQELERERARLSAEISQQWHEYQKRPRRTFLSARTREYKYAAYMDAWRAKVERVGNLNYPEEAKSRGLTGSLVLDVAINPDGSVNAIVVKRGSGFKVLDDAAVRIVRLAAPFAPFPENIRKETDILHITRTWDFLHGSKLRSR
jgi:protein TonB